MTEQSSSQSANGNAARSSLLFSVTAAMKSGRMSPCRDSLSSLQPTETTRQTGGDAGVGGDSFSRLTFSEMKTAFGTGFVIDIGTLIVEVS